MAILPEGPGKLYNQSIMNVISVWKDWSVDYKVLSAGLEFEIFICRYFKGTFVSKIFWKFIRKFVEKLNSCELWRTFVKNFNYDAGICLVIFTEDDGNAQFCSESPYLESLQTK